MKITTTSSKIVEAFFDYIEIMGSSRAESISKKEYEFFANVSRDDQGISFDGFDGEARFAKKQLESFLNNKLSKK